uniref:Uncharacterized protein LOC100366896 n=1 Tax=Saccoglossus kowalevskii TaxID=10224 RepID=A0ABM0GKE8_SACKO|nr:PREDICTED: uncharacterized protein LOC100366896 [Saccoglossus kowalevskii]
MDVNKVVRAQAIWRGALVRKYFRQIRHSYEEIVQEIDNDQKEVGVEWTSSLVCKPKVYFGKKPQKRDNVGRVCGISSTLGQVVSVIPMAEQPFNVVFDETLDCNEDSGNEEQMNNVENDVYQDCGLQTPSPGGLNGRRILGEIKDSPGIDEKSGSESNLLGAFRNSQVDKENQSPVPQIQARIHSDIGFEIHLMLRIKMNLRMGEMNRQVM